MSIDQKLQNILDRYLDINKKLSEQNIHSASELIKLNKEFAELGPIVEKIEEYKKLKKEKENLIDLINNEKDMDIKKKQNQSFKKFRKTFPK